MAEPTVQNDFDSRFWAEIIENLPSAMPLLKTLTTFGRSLSTPIIQELLKSGGDKSSPVQGPDSLVISPCSAVCEDPAKGYHTPEQHRYFDFAKRKLLEGEKKSNIIRNQPWLLLEHGIRAKSLHYLDGFLFFGWPSTIKNSKQCFAVIISKSNKLIPGVKFQHADRKADVWELTGLEKVDNKFNIIEANKLLKEALTETKNTSGHLNIPVEKIVESYELDPESLPLTFCVAEIIRNASKVAVPPKMLGGMCKLLQQWEKRYREGIQAIEGCQALENADIEDQLQKYHASLDSIEKTLKQFYALIKTKDAQDDDDSQISDIRLYIERISLTCKGLTEVFECRDFQTLCNLQEIQNSCATVTRWLMKYAAGLDYESNYFAEAFKLHFAQLILDKKVEPAKLNTPSSLASYCRKTIFYQLREQIIKEKTGLSCKMYSSIWEKRKIEQMLYLQSGCRPTDEEIAGKMKIPLEQFYEIKSAESSLAHYEFDEERDSDTDNNDEASEF